MFTIGLTGGIGSGKSTVAEIMKGLGAVLVDADRVGWDVYRSGSQGGAHESGKESARGAPRGAPREAPREAQGYRAVVDEFGDEIVGPDGEVDRKKLGSIVFGDPARMKALTGIVWPLIAGAVSDRIAEETARGTETLVVEAAVMFEAGWERLFDEIWVVTARRETAVERLMVRDGVPEQAVRARMAAQLPDEERVRRADVVIENDGDLPDLKRLVESVWRDHQEKQA